MTNIATTERPTRNSTATDEMRSISKFMIECADWFDANPNRQFRFCKMPRPAFDFAYRAPTGGPSVFVHAFLHSGFRADKAVQGLAPDADLDVVVRRPVSHKHGVKPLPHMIPVSDMPASVRHADNDETGDWLFSGFPTAANA